MLVPISVIACSRPTERLLDQLVAPGTTVILDRRAALEMGAGGRMIPPGRLAMSEPDTYRRSPGCDCCAVREDLVSSVVRAVRRATPPRRLVVLVDHRADDLLTAISTILSSIEISQRCTLDGVVAHVDAIELTTQLMTRAELTDDATSRAVAIADQIVIDGRDQVTDDAFQLLTTSLADRAGFAEIVDGANPAAFGDGVMDAWHGAPAARSLAPRQPGGPATIVLRVDEPLDAEAIDGWLDLLIARHASRLLRLQGALSVVGNDERTCCYGVRSFATSHSEREHLRTRSTQSVLAICGIGLDADELSESFLTTIAP